MLPGVVARESCLGQAGVDGIWSGRYGGKLHARSDSRINDRAASPSPERKGPSMGLCEGSCDHIPAPPLPVMSPRVTEGFLLPCFGGGAHCPTGPPQIAGFCICVDLEPTSLWSACGGPGSAFTINVNLDPSLRTAFGHWQKLWCPVLLSPCLEPRLLMVPFSVGVTWCLCP